MVAQSFDLEVKKGKSRLSKRQKKRKREVEAAGREYRVQRYDGPMDEFY